MSPSDSTHLRAQIAPTLAALEAKRARQLGTCKSAALWCGGLGVVGALVLAGVGGGLNLWMIVPIVIMGAIYLFIANGENKNYRDGFKTMVMPQLVKTFGDLTYAPQSGLSESAFNRANLYPDPDRYSCEDLIEGRVGATRVQMSEIHAEDKRESTNSKGHTSTTYTTIFQGLFVIADFNKEFRGITYILPEGLSGSLGAFGRGLQSLGGKMGGRGALVQLEDPEFERAFVVYGSDQTEARYILSSALMRRLLNLKQHFNNGELSAVFSGGSLYLMISKTDNWFEPPALSTPLTFESVQNTLKQLQMATGIVEELDLNTRIWSKG